jgi:hypothetical protein
MKLTYLLLVSLVFLDVGCKNDDDDSGPAPQGSISGELRLADEFGAVLSDHSGMNISSDQGSTTVSEASGEFRLSGLATGNHDLSYEKQGFGTYKKFDIQVTGGTDATLLNGIDYLGQKSTTIISNLTVTPNTPGSTFNIGCTITPPPTPSQPRPFRLFFGKDGAVSSSDYHYAPSNTWLATTGSGSILNYDCAELYTHGFSSGETIYLIAYGDSKYSNSWTDPLSGKKVYPNVNSAAPSNVVSFVLP